MLADPGGGDELGDAGRRLTLPLERIEVEPEPEPGRD